MDETLQLKGRQRLGEQIKNIYMLTHFRYRHKRLKVKNRVGAKEDIGVGGC